MRIIQHRKQITETEYSRDFDYDGHSGWGFSFECDESGNLLQESERYAACLTGEVEGKRVIDRGIRSYTRTYTEPAIGKCDCGRAVYLDGFTNTCDCGRDYNWAGQLLAPRSQWGEETGESLSDILNIP